ncbi:MAG: SDR family oxidoreductase [Muribaculaceae bacterium]|nr:SDR family oxidoreductase [Muribaculaceae bacterium]
MANPFDLINKTILITGASSGIGRSTAIECSRMGASVIVTGRNEDRLRDTLKDLAGEGLQMIVADLTDENDLNELVKSIGEIDGLVLCSGKGLMQPVLFSTIEKFSDILGTNFLYPMELMRLLLKKKKIRRNASIISVASMGGTHFYTVGNGMYGASKAALDSYMKFCARELAPKGIRVNTVLPAMVDTPLIHRGTVTEEEHKADAEKYPMKRYGRPEDIAYAIIYLLSDAASWVTGTSLVIDGGRSLVN